MPWGTVELEAEVETWHAGLSDHDRGRVAFYFDLLEDRGVALGEPYTRQLRGKLRELRFYLGSARQRITYYIASGRRIVLLTVFAKSRQRHEAEIKRADRAMQRCIERGHTAEE